MNVGLGIPRAGTVSSYVLLHFFDGLGENSQDGFCQPMAAKNPMRLLLPPVFDYSKQATILALDDLPEQKDDNYVEVMATQVKKFVKITMFQSFFLRPVLMK